MQRVWDLFGNREFWMYLAIAALAVCFFGYLYQFRVLVPTYTDWLMAEGDPSQHYLGWKGYRAGDWQFPLGLTDRLAYPDSTSVIFTDSIPLLAVPFKVLSPILPAEFQYFGLWGIACFVLQGALSARILRRFVSSRLAVVLGSAFFIGAPIMIVRMFGHTALAGQWLLLFALYPLFACEEYADLRKAVRFAILLGALSASIHVYFLLMTGILLAGFLIADLIQRRSLRRTMAILASFLGSAALVIWLLGGFSAGMKADGGGLGVYSMNLYAFFNPRVAFLNPPRWSCLLQDQPLYLFEQYEGFLYLGAGIFLVLAVAFVFLVGSGRMKQILSVYRAVWIGLLVVCGMSLFVALSPVVTYKDKLLFTIPTPEAVAHLWSIFRSTGRFGWPIVYVAMLGGMIAICRLMTRRTAIVLLALALCLQMYDGHGAYQGVHARYLTRQQYVSLLSNTAFWRELAAEPALKHLSAPYLPINQRNPRAAHDWMFALTDYALSAGWSVNDFYFGRSRLEAAKAERQEVLASLPEDTALLFLSLGSCAGLDLHKYAVDGWIVGLRQPLAGQEEAAYDFGYETDVVRYLEELKTCPYTVFIAVRDDASQSLTEEMQEHLSALGVTSRLKGQFRASFYAVIDQGQLVQEGFSPDQQVRASGTLGDTTYAVLSAGNTAGSESSIVLNGIEYDRDGRGLNIVVYDRQTGTCIDSVCFDTCSGLACTR